MFVFKYGRASRGLQPSSPEWIGAAIGAAGSILGGVLGSSGQKDANDANLQIAQENREFQERMSNTAYQRGTADMKAAGINPLMAGMKGGASTPSGATATMQNEKAALASSSSTAFQAAIQAQSLEADLENK